jgi:cytochrome c biogenesis protein CcmG/thiol:disulfide interchange protein DsbE
MKGTVFLIPVAIFLGIAAFFYAGLRNGPANIIPSPLVGKPPPAFVLEALGPEFQSFAASDLAQGKPILVNFWASWCAPCRIEAPVLEELAQREDLAVYGVAYKDAPEDSREFLTEFGNPFARLAADPDGRVAIDWGVTAVPETFVIDADGIVRARFAGALTQEAVRDIILPAAGL